MVDPRSSSLRTLRSLSRQHPSTFSATSAHARRRLHITGAYSAPPINGSNNSTLYASRTLADLKQECERRALASDGSKNELIERLSNHDMLQTRAFSIAMRRIDGPVFGSSRHFNTSRANKTMNDSSTMDFVYMPNHATFEGNPPSTMPQVPIVSDVHTNYDGTPTIEHNPMKPQIYTVADRSSDVAVSPMSEVVDNHSIDIDPYQLTKTVEASREAELRQKNAAQEPEKGILGELWEGLVDDFWGSKSKPVLHH